MFAAARALFVPGKPMPTIPQIAARARVQKTTVYRRWRTVETLLFEALRAVAAAGIPVPNTGALRTDLRALVRTSNAYLASDEGRSMTALLLALPDDVKRTYWAKRYEALRVPFDRAAARGEIEPRDDWSLYIGLSAAQFYFHSWAKGELVPLARRYEVVDVVLGALGRKV